MRPQSRNTRIFLSIVGVIALLNILKEPNDVISWIFLCFFVAYIFFPNVIWPLWAQKDYQKQKQIYGPMTISFDDNTISFKMKAGEVTYRWIYKFSVTPDMLIIYPTYNRQTAHIILKKFCQNEDQFNRIVRVAKKLKEFEI
jgi:hypothetical protein